MSVISELRMRPGTAASYDRWDATPRTRLVLSGLVIFVLLCGANLATTLYPGLQQSLGLGPMGTSVAFASYVMALIVFLVTVGHWSDHIGRRAALLLAVLIGLAGTLVFGTADDLLGLCAGRGLQGASVALATGASAAALRELLPSKPEWASRFTLLASSGGVAVGPVIGGLLALLPGGLGTAFTVQAVALVLLLVPLLLVRARPAIAVAAPGTRGRALAPRVASVPSGARGEFWLAALTGFLSFAIFGFILSLAPGYLAEIFAISWLPVIGALAGLALGVSALVQLTQIRGRHLQTVALLLMAAGMGALLLGLEAALLPVVVLAMIVIGLGQGLAFRAAFSAAVDAVAPSEHASTVSAIYVVTYLGSTIPVIGLGWAAGHFGLQASIQVFLIGCVLMALGLGIALVRSTRAARTGATR